RSRFLDESRSGPSELKTHTGAINSTKSIIVHICLSDIETLSAIASDERRILVHDVLDDDEQLRPVLERAVVQRKVIVGHGIDMVIVDRRILRGGGRAGRGTFNEGVVVKHRARTSHSQRDAGGTIAVGCHADITKIRGMQVPAEDSETTN